MRSSSCSTAASSKRASKQEILKPPHHEYTELLLSSVPEMDPEWLDNLLEDREVA
jgi:peptide/nickel transport system ATP-binding protein